MSDDELEKIIESTGRDKVFARARELGWGQETPPKWVWQGIVAELLAATSPNLTTPRRRE